MAPSATTTSTTTSSTRAPPFRHSLSPKNLAYALSQSKTASYPDTTFATSGSRGPSSTASSASSAAQIRHLAWSPTGALIATADTRILRVWNPEKPGVRFSTELKLPPGAAAPAAAAGRRAPPASPHLRGTERVAWNAGREAELASVDLDGVVRFWDVRAKAALVGSVEAGGEGFSLAWRPPWSGGGDGEGDVVVGRKDDNLVSISRATMSVISSQRQPVQTNQIAFSNSGRELLLTTGDGHVKIVDYPSLTPLHTLNAHTSSCSAIAICPRGRHIAVGGSDALVSLWDTATFAPRYTVPDLPGPVRAVSFSFDGSYLVAGSEEGAGGLQVVHVEDGEVAATVGTEGKTAPCVAWHPSRYLIAYGGGDPSGLKIVGAAGVLL